MSDTPDPTWISGDRGNTDRASDERTAKLPVVIVGGFHDAALTAQFVRSLPSFVRPYIADMADVSPVDPFAVHQWLSETLKKSSIASSIPVVGIGFSAGVVGLAGALAMWNQQGGNQQGAVARLIAVDGWGVPVVGLPVCRMSHDRFTHVSTLPLDLFSDAGKVNFYADPSVEHLSLWGEPEAAVGWQVDRWQMAEKAGMPMSAADFVRRVLRAEWNQIFKWR
ncbi:MAG: hypothetical protein AAGB19_00045 [Cyanobacteria bacterium P01_F01_bin.3]